MVTILHLITTLGSGGAERMLSRLVTHDGTRAGVRHQVVCLVEDGMQVYGPILRKAGIQVECLGMRRGRPSLAALARLVAILRKSRPDIVMTWLYHADLLGTIAARLAGIRRVVWNIRCSDMDLARYGRGTRWTVALLSRLSPWPWAIGVNSQAGRRAHEALGYVPRRWTHLPNGLDLDEWRPDAADRTSVREELGLRDQDVAIVMVARVDPMKDHASLLEAARKLLRRQPSARFFLVGRDTHTLVLPPQLSGVVVALGERRDVARLLRGFDISVLSSLSEGFPNVIAEAMASGLPCVATDVGDCAVLVGDTGKIVAARQPDALADALDTLIAEGPEALARRGRDARARVAAHWSIASAVQAYDRLWDDAMGGGIA